MLKIVFPVKFDGFSVIIVIRVYGKKTTASPVTGNEKLLYHINKR